MAFNHAARRRGELATLHPLYRIWQGMKGRCLNPNNRKYHRYGGRGISVCQPWSDDFWIFADYVREHLGERPSHDHSIDRIDNDGNYEPGNIRWATRYEQAATREVTDRMRQAQRDRQARARG